MPHAHVNGIDIYYEDTGSETPLLLIPGLSCCTLDWEPLRPALEPHFRLVAVDNRGAGRSAAPPGPYTTRLLADDAAALLDQLGIARAHVMGFSLGGGIAQELALAYPERVDRLVLLSTFGCPLARVTDPWLTGFVQAYEQDIDRASRELWTMGWTLSPAFMTQPEQVAAALEAALDPAYPVAPAHGVASQADAARTHSALPRLPQITAPTLVLVGAEDIITPVCCAQDLAAAIPNATLQVLARGGHAVLAEYPEETAAAVLAFLA